MPLSRRSFAVAALALVAAPRLAQAAPVSAETSLWNGVELLDGNGRTFTLAERPAPRTLVKLWANWCPACLSEMPSLADLRAGERGALDVLLLSHPQYWERDKATARARGLPFELVTFSPRNGDAVTRAALLDQNGAYVVPRSLLFRGGTLSWRRDGATNWTAAGVMQSVHA